MSEPNKVQHTSVAGSGTSIGIAFTSTTTAGNLLIAMVIGNTGTTDTCTCSDPVNGAYTATPASPARNTTQAYSSWIFYFKNAASLSTIQQITATFSLSQGFSGMWIIEVSGASITVPFDKETSALSNVSSVPDPGSTALSFNSEIILESSIVAASDTVGNTFTDLTAISGNDGQYKVVSNGTWGVSAFATANANWLAQAATFTDAIGGFSGFTPDEDYFSASQIWPTGSIVSLW